VLTKASSGRMQNSAVQNSSLELSREEIRTVLAWESREISLAGFGNSNGEFCKEEYVKVLYLQVYR
jgi:hypothetical protein